MGFELPFVIGPEYIAVALFGVVIGIIYVVFLYKSQDLLLG